MSLLKREFEIKDGPSIQMITYIMDGRGPSPSNPPKVTVKMGAFRDMPEYKTYFTKSDCERFARLLLDASKDL